MAAQVSQAALAGNEPSHDFAMNSAWLGVSLIAAGLLSWLRLIALDGDLAPRRTKNFAFPGPACRREADPRRPAAAENPRHLALGRGHRHRLGPDHCPATRTLTAKIHPCATEGVNLGPLEPPATGPRAGPPSYPDGKITNCSAVQPPSQASPPYA